VHQDHLDIAAAPGIERLAGAERQHAHLDCGLALEDGEEMAEQPALLRGGGRRERDVPLLRLGGQSKREKA